MTPDITIKVEKDTSNEVLSALLSAVSGRKLKDRVGYNLTRMVQGNLRSLPHNKQGWEPQGFYDKAARGTSYEVTETGAVVSVDNPDAPGAIKFAYNQGQEGRIRIESKGKLLTIPAREEFYGHSAGEFDNLKYVQFGKGGAKALVINTGGAELVDFSTGKGRSSGRMGWSKGGIGARSEGMVAYWLADFVEQDARPEILPPVPEMMANVNATVVDTLKQFHNGKDFYN